MLYEALCAHRGKALRRHRQKTRRISSQGETTSARDQGGFVKNHIKSLCVRFRGPFSTARRKRDVAGFPADAVEEFVIYTSGAGSLATRAHTQAYRRQMKTWFRINFCSGCTTVLQGCSKIQGRTRGQPRALQSEKKREIPNI